MAGVALGDIPAAFAWQALTALGWVWWHPWSPLVARGAAVGSVALGDLHAPFALCMAGMALGDIPAAFAW